MRKKIEANSENYKKYQSIVSIIEKELTTLHNETALYSSSSPIITHPSYNKLLAMGDVIVPFLFNRMIQKGASWYYFHLFRDLTKQNPVNKAHRGKFLATLSDWVQWYLHSDYHKNDDIYHGLISDKE